MTRRRALIVHLKMPTFDRDSGSQDVDNMIRWLVDAGWSVTYLAQESPEDTEERHAQRLRQMGVATFCGFDWAPHLLETDDFDLAIIAFWYLAEELTPLIREISPQTRVVVNSIDVHFLRLARRAFVGGEPLDQTFGTETVQELNAYSDADAVFTVSDKERDLLRDFLGHDAVFTVPLAERVERSTVPLAERRGMYFVGSFRHVPNREALDFFAGEVMPLLDPELLERHPFTVVGDWLDKAPLQVDRDTHGLNLVGWVPDLTPYMERSRLAVVPLLHGAGLKRKVLQAMMAYTPVVTTPVGAEGFDLVDGRHALIAADACEMAAAVTRLLTDDDLWTELADAGADHIDELHGLEAIEAQFGEIVDSVMARPVRISAGPADGSARPTRPANPAREKILAAATGEGPVLVVTEGDDDLTDLGRQAWHFPEARDGAWAGYDPVDGRAALTHLEAQRDRGARYFALPARSFSWTERFPELFDHLAATARRIHRDEHVAVYDLDPQPSTTVLDQPVSASVVVAGTFAAHRSGPPPELVEELESTEWLSVQQVWQPAGEQHDASIPTEDADFVVHIDDNAVLAPGFLEHLIRTHATLDVDRVQPAHTAGPAGGPPLTARHLGVVGREVDAVTPLPVLSVRNGASVEGATVLADEVTVGLRAPIEAADDGDSFAFVRRVWVAGPDGRVRGIDRPEPVSAPEISVTIATYNRTDLLKAALESFADQTIDPSRYEVVLVDDGSDTPVVDAMVAEFAGRMQIVGVEAGHAGRSATKNLSVMLARAPIVLLFDDDDQARPDYLERHLLAHEAEPAEGVAILGHTNWAAGLEISPLMHFITEVDQLMFSYRKLRNGESLDWQGFWAGRISCKRSLLTRHGLHDLRLADSEDVEMGWRLMPHGLRVVYDASAVSEMVRPLDFDSFCNRTQAKGRALAAMAALHPDTPIAEQLEQGDADVRWERGREREADLRHKVAELEPLAVSDDAVLRELHWAYRETFRILHAKGVVEARAGIHTPPTHPTTVQPFAGTDPELLYDGSPSGAGDPVLSITIPVWSRSEELAEMAQQTIDRIWEVATVPTEVVVVDNGSPHEVPLAAKVYRYPENKGVATAWNAGIRLATADMFVVLNSDCLVEPGWDAALLEAATDARRIVFPYTNHCDWRGFRQGEQSGTTGWCFMMSRAVREEIGVFDEWFSPAYGEDTDYWHRAWELGVELTPVPAARVVHEGHSTSSTNPLFDMLLLGHRYHYAWKHGVEPLARPAFYRRTITEYHGSHRPPRLGAWWSTAVRVAKARRRR